MLSIVYGPEVYDPEVMPEPILLLSRDDFSNVAAFGSTAVTTAPTAVDLMAADDTGLSDTDDLTNRDNSVPEKTLSFEVAGTIAGAAVTLYADGVAIGSAWSYGSTTVVTTDGSSDLVDGLHAITARQVLWGQTESVDSPALDVTIDTLTPVLDEYLAFKLLAGDPGGGDVFGLSVSVSGTTAIVGAYGNDDAGTSSGSAYIYEQTPTGWQQVAKLTADDAAADDRFGYGVSISGTRAIVGAYLDDDNGSSSGSAYIFEQTATGWEQVAKLTAADGAVDDNFGRHVSISGTTVIVGASWDDDRGTSSGSAYIFEQTPIGWEQVAKLTAADGTALDYFGDSVSISGTTAIVGAHGNDDAGSFSGSAYIFEQTTTGWEQVAKLRAADGMEGDHFGCGVSIDGTMAVVGAYMDDDAGSSSGSAYIFEQTATGWEQVAKLTADDGAEVDRFGHAVSISGTTAIVGAYMDDDDGTDTGSAYVFEQTPTGWEQVTKLTAYDAAGGDFFGYSVAISDTTMLVGATGDGNNVGSAYMFSNALFTLDLQTASDSGVSYADNLTNDTTPTFDVTAGPYYRVYRDGVQVSGDYEDGVTYTSEALPDGTYDFTVCAVDAAGNEASPSVALSVTIDTVAPSVSGVVPDLQAGSDLGISDTDNLTNDNTPTFDVSGVPYYRFHLDGTDIGTAYETGEFTLPAQTDGTYDVAIIAVDAAGNASALGDSLAVTIDTAPPSAPAAAPDLQAASDSGLSDTDNITNDATPTLDITASGYYRIYRDGTLVSAPYETAATYTPATLFDGTYSYTTVAVDEAGNESAPSPALEMTIDTASPSWNELVMESKLLAADADGGDYFGNSVAISGTTAIVGAYYDEDAGSFSGSVYIFEQTATGWEQTIKLVPDELEDRNYFGCSVAICGTLAIVGACGDDDNGSTSGAAYIFERTATGWEQVAKLTPDDGASGDNFGNSVSISGTTVIVGSCYDDDLGSSSGSAYIFEQTATGWEQVTKLTSDDGALGDYFGYSVSISGTTIIVGAYGDDDHGDSSGSAYVFEQTATGWEQVAKLTPDDGAERDYFGYSVSISGTTIIAGAYRDDDCGTDSGSAYVFEQTATGWWQVAKLTPDDDANSDYFGYSVSISDATAIVGAYLDDDCGVDSGSAYIFEQTASGWKQITKFLPYGNGAQGDHFGCSVSISDAVALVGMAYDDSSGTNSGSAYIFSNPVPAVDLQAASDTGVSDTDDVTSDTTPTFDTTAAPFYRMYRDDVQVTGDYESGPYASPELPYGTYEYKAQAVDAAGNKASIGDPLTVTIAPSPSADPGGPYTTNEGTTITLDASGSTTPNGTIVSYEWDLDGDGFYDDAVGATTDYVCTSSGVYSVAVRVTDSLGLTHTVTTTVTVNNVAPTADAGGPYVVLQDTQITLTAVGSSDPGNDIVSYEWDLDGDGEYDDSSSVVVSFDRSAIGDYPVSVRVTDDDGAFDTDDVIVSVVPPQVITVTSLLDNTDVDGLITFREALYAAENNTAVGDAPAGMHGLDIIAFDSSLYASGPATITLTGADISISDDIEIQGPGSQWLTLDANNSNDLDFLAFNNNDMARISGLTITGSHSRAIYSDHSNVTLEDCVITGNLGMGVYSRYYSEVVIRNSTISENREYGLYSNYSDLTVEHCNIINNGWVDSPNVPAGGGIANISKSTLLVIDSTIMGNDNLYGFGGGIYNASAVCTVINCIIADNSARQGGGISNGGYSMTIVNTTITGNTASDAGGGIGNGRGLSITLNNSIVAKNQSPDSPDVYQTIATTGLSGSNNLIGIGSDKISIVDGVDGNQVGTEENPIDPRLSVQGYLLPGSPAIDAGNNALAVDARGQPLTTDITGNSRIVGPSVDIGAYEVPVWPFLSGDANLDGCVDGSDATILAGNWQAGVDDGQTATWSMGDFNGDGRVDGSDATILATNWGAGTTPRIPGDANGDNRVDGSDATILASYWQTGVSDGRKATWPMGDFNNDGRVDGSDATLLSTHWLEGVDFTALAKDLASLSAKKSTTASDALFALELDPYADLE